MAKDIFYLPRRGAAISLGCTVYPERSEGHFCMSGNSIVRNKDNIKKMPAGHGRQAL